jgi:hypothetical protein
VLDPDELHDVASTFGVDEQQVLHDHLISHLLEICPPAAPAHPARAPRFRSRTRSRCTRPVDGPSTAREPAGGAPAD